MPLPQWLFGSKAEGREGEGAEEVGPAGTSHVMRAGPLLPPAAQLPRELTHPREAGAEDEAETGASAGGGAPSSSSAAVPGSSGSSSGSGSNHAAAAAAAKLRLAPRGLPAKALPSFCNADLRTTVEELQRWLGWPDGFWEQTLDIAAALACFRPVFAVRAPGRGTWQRSGVGCADPSHIQMRTALASARPCPCCSMQHGHGTQPAR